jgi:hypothetical protein
MLSLSVGVIPVLFPVITFLLSIIITYFIDNFLKRQAFIKVVAQSTASHT